MKFLSFASKISKVKHLTEDVIILSLTPPEDFTFKAGQFVTLAITNKEGIKRMRSYSILNNPSKKNTLDLCIKLIPEGFASEIFKESKTGDEFNIKGPFGVFTFDKEAEVKEHCFIGTGTGIVPFYSMIHEWLDKLPEKKFTLIAGYKNKKNILATEIIVSMLLGETLSTQRIKSFQYKQVIMRLMQN